MGGGKDSGKSAARAQERANQAAQSEIRRQFNVTQRNLQPFLDSGTSQIPIVEERSTLEGLDEILGQIFGSENFQNLRDERGLAVQGQLGAAGLTRSGTALQEAARVPTDLGFQLEQLLTGRAGNIAGSGQNAAAQLGTFGQNASGSIAGLSQNTGQAQANGRLADQQASAQGFQNTLNTAATIGSIFFSDPALKENVVKVGEIRDLNVYQWDWKPETAGTIIEKCGTLGFMADEVKEKYPHHVYESAGFMMIDYSQLLSELDEITAAKIAELDILIQEERHAESEQY